MFKNSTYVVMALIIIGILGIYYLNFNVSEVSSLSKDQGDWGSFGSYFGGVVGPILAFLAYLGVREQIKIQQSLIDQQNSNKALEDHLLRIKESFERLLKLTDEAISPLEKGASINLSETLKGDLENAASDIDTIHVLDDLIHAGRLIQGAQFVYMSYLSLIEESIKHLKIDTPLNEHKWVAIVTWREFEKRALFLLHIMRKAERLTEVNPELYAEQYKEIILYTGAYERWEQEWKRMGLGF